jgi:hypothetical protein
LVKIRTLFHVGKIPEIFIVLKSLRKDLNTYGLSILSRRRRRRKRERRMKVSRETHFRAANFSVTRIEAETNVRKVPKKMAKQPNKEGKKQKGGKTF